MGEVFLARQRGIEGFARDVVIKQIHANYADDPEFVNMFLQEARIAALLDHPNIVQIFELGKKDRSYFIVMEYVEGLSLSRLLRAAGGRVPLWAAIQITCGVAEGLQFAHNKAVRGAPLNLVHRDVSPPNILLSTSGSIKLADFGIAKVRWSVTQTQTGMVKGKYYYISPEHARGEPVDRRADIYALGLVLYEMTTGRRAYSVENDSEVLRAVASGAITPPADVVPSYPRDLERVVLRALARDPDDRPSECSELQEQLSTLLMRRNEVVTPSKLGQLVAELVEQERLLREEQQRAAQEAATGTDYGAATVVDASTFAEHASPDDREAEKAPQEPTEIDNVFELETLLLHAAEPTPEPPEAPTARLRAPNQNVQDARDAGAGEASGRDAGEGTPPRDVVVAPKPEDATAESLLPPGYSADEEATKLDTRLPPLEEPPRLEPRTGPVARPSTDEVYPPPRFRVIWPVFIAALTIVAAVSGGITWCLLAP
jgi:hypothetical protein